MFVFLGIFILLAVYVIIRDMRDMREEKVINDVRTNLYLGMGTPTTTSVMVVDDNDVCNDGVTYIPPTYTFDSIMAHTLGGADMDDHGVFTYCVCGAPVYTPMHGTCYTYRTTGTHKHTMVA